MKRSRRIKRVIRSKPTIEGAGVHLRRAFGFGEAPELDPFLLLDDFRSDDPRRYLRGFPWHPHRGIETITYMLRGNVEHRDSMGNGGVIGPGDMQWMTAGSGIIHQEMPKGDKDGRMGGFQLWANLPASHKMMEPRYQGIESGEIPEVTAKDGARVRVICGEVEDTKGPVQGVVIDPEYLDVTIPAGSEATRETKEGHTALAYVIEGRAVFCKEKDPFSYRVEGENYFDMETSPFVDDGSLILFDDGEQVTVSTDDLPVRFLFVTGKPLREPVAWYGPIVMNTQEELRVAFEEYREGTFLKHAKR